MNRFWVLRDGTIIGAAPNREEAIEMIRQHQQRETHYLLKASFSIMYAEQEFIPYQDMGKRKESAR